MKSLPRILCFLYFLFFLLPLQQGRSSEGPLLWPKGKIPYQFEKNLPPQDPLRQTVEAAMAQFEKQLEGILDFEDCGKCTSSTLSHYLVVGKRKRCFSQEVGRAAGKKSKGKVRQIMGVHPSCNLKGVISHILGHVIGLHHQHQRSDRDQYLKMNSRFFPRGPEDSTLAPVYPQALGLYDFESLMHFSSFLDLENKKVKGPVMVKRKDGSPIKGGWPWSPQGGTLRDLSAIWELYATQWGWKPFEREEEGLFPVDLTEPPAVIFQPKGKEGKWERWGRGRDNRLYLTGKRVEEVKEELFSDPAVLALPGGKRDIFFSDSSHHIVQISLPGGKRTSLDGPATVTRPAVVLRPLTGTRELIIRGTDSKVYRRSFDQGAWGEWEDLGGQMAVAPSVFSWPHEDRLDLVAVDAEGNVWQKVWLEGRWWPSANTWSREGMGDVKVQPSPLGIISCQSGQIGLLARGPRGILYTKFWFGQWGEWVPIGGIIKSAPLPACDSEGTLHVWALGEDWGLWHRKFNVLF